MLQAALRVSYTSPKVMHWITQLLIWLNINADRLDTEIPYFTYVIDEIAKRPVREFLEDGDYALGVNTPHVVLNYLDFLLWHNDRNVDFSFEFRNSVEHWYPAIHRKVRSPDGKTMSTVSATCVWCSAISIRVFPTCRQRLRRAPSRK